MPTSRRRTHEHTATTKNGSIWQKRKKGEGFNETERSYNGIVYSKIVYIYVVIYDHTTYMYVCCIYLCYKITLYSTHTNEPSKLIKINNQLTQIYRFLVLVVAAVIPLHPSYTVHSIRDPPATNRIYIFTTTVSILYFIFYIHI